MRTVNNNVNNTLRQLGLLVLTLSRQTSANHLSRRTTAASTTESTWAVPAGKTLSSWSSWETFRDCPRCGYGLRTRLRYCIGHLEDPENYKKYFCPGQDLEYQECPKRVCAPQWTSWRAWTGCSQSCGRSYRQRTRRCLQTNRYVDSKVCGNDDLNGYGEVQIEQCNLQSCHTEDSLNEICGQIQEPAPETKQRPRIRIKDGVEIDPRFAPWQASFMYRECRGGPCFWQHVCGASLVHPSWVITAAHCIVGLGYNIDLETPGRRWRVALGKQHTDRCQSYNANDCDSEIMHSSTINWIVLSPEWKPKPVPVADLALVKLERPAQFNTYIQPVCLPNGVTPRHEETCTTPGYGYHKATTKDEARANPIALTTGSQTRPLRSAKVNVATQEVCRNAGRWYKLLRSTYHVCASAENAEQDTCEGDSGGPMVCIDDKPQNPKMKERHYLSGITSFSFVTCGTPGHYGIYTNVVQHEKWIKCQILETESCQNHEDSVSIEISPDDEEHSSRRAPRSLSNASTVDLNVYYSSLNSTNY